MIMIQLPIISVAGGRGATRPNLKDAKNICYLLYICIAELLQFLLAVVEYTEFGHRI